MQPDSPDDRVAVALASPTPADAVLELARRLRDEGMPLPGLLALYDRFRERHSLDTDETCYDAVLDAMDSVSGWCSPSDQLYPNAGPTA